jgi:hypothetical protein
MVPSRGALEYVTAYHAMCATDVVHEQAFAHIAHHARVVDYSTVTACASGRMRAPAGTPTKLRSLRTLTTPKLVQSAKSVTLLR